MKTYDVLNAIDCTQEVFGIAYFMRISHLGKRKESFIHNDVNLSLRIRWHGFNGGVYIP